MTPDYTLMSTRELIEACRTDPNKWAEAYCQHIPRSDFALAFQWFQLALMAQEKAAK
jgi:hypothetical protein